MSRVYMFCKFSDKNPIAMSKCRSSNAFLSFLKIGLPFPKHDKVCNPFSTTVYLLSYDHDTP